MMIKWEEAVAVARAAGFNLAARKLRIELKRAPDMSALEAIAILEAMAERPMHVATDCEHTDAYYLDDAACDRCGLWPGRPPKRPL